ncbi:hypothetical protein [Acidovorax soli]|uniref:hypothetical protein n=1 Tax=Acidovorax TaxID=12916 RepID=UPI0026ED3AA3|nr:hypothetical protein [Acidovorax soli]MCM2346652.1 hypothetical protein [Acidovorax soli]
MNVSVMLMQSTVAISLSARPPLVPEGLHHAPNDETCDTGENNFTATPLATRVAALITGDGCERKTDHSATITNIPPTAVDTAFPVSTPESLKTP